MSAELIAGIAATAVVSAFCTCTLVRYVKQRRIFKGEAVRFGHVLETSLNEIFMFDAKTLRFSLVNRGARMNLGYSMAELAEMTPLDVKPAHTPASFATLLAPLRSGEVEAVQFETVHKRKNGTTYAVEVNLQFYADEVAPTFVAMIQDVTERNETAEALQFQLALATSASDASPNGVLVISSASEWISYNQRFLEMWGISTKIADAGTFQERMIAMTRPVADPAGFLAVVDDIIHTSEPVSHVEVALADGRTFELHSAPVRNPDGGSYGRLWHCRDITKAKLVAVELDHHRHQLERLVAERTHDLRDANVQLHSEVAERRILELELTRQANHDRLTGLANRHQLETEFPRSLAQVHRGKRLALVVMDLDGFKNVNDTLGHSTGDDLLMQVADRLRRAVRSRDLLVRLGGDEFALVINDATDKTCRRVLGRLAEVFREPYLLDEHPFSISVSIGVAYTDDPNAFESDEQCFLDVMRRADLAMYRSKAEGRQVSYYDVKADRRVQEWAWLENEVRHTIERDQLELHFQPVFDLRSEIVITAEALVRWRHPDRGLIMPDRFINVAEESGFIIELDRWVMAEATRLAARDHFCVNINVAPRTLVSPDLVMHVERCLAESGLSAHQLAIEVTEQALAHIETTRPVLEAIQALGVQVVIDDFGTGYSSLSYVQHYPLSGIKLDQSFLPLLGQDPKTNAIAATVIHLAHTLGLTVVAEGVETETQLNWLKDANCNAAQGFHLGRPEPLDDLPTDRALAAATE